MPVKKVGKKFTVKDKEYNTQDEANKAYMSYIGKAMGVEQKPEKDNGKESDKDKKKKKS